MGNSSLTSQPCNLRITEEQFNELYPDMEGYYEYFNNPPPLGISKPHFEKYYLSNKLWRLNNIYSVIDKSGNPVTFRMNYAQHRVYAASRIHPRVIILKSRQQGISTFWLVSYFDDAVFCPYLNIGLMAQGTDEASTLLDRTKFLWDTLDDEIKAFLSVNSDKDNSKEYAFSNSSKIFIRVSFRSATLQRLHISEFGKIANANPKRAKETKTGTLQALGKGNTGVIESTAEGRNMFKQMWDDSVIALNSGQMTTKDFYPVFLSWLDDPDCNLDIDQAETEKSREYFEQLQAKHGLVATQAQRNFWIAQFRELKGDIYQEYPATPEEAFLASRDGTYYSKLFSRHLIEGKRINKDLYDPNLDTDVYFDLGVDDYFVLAFVQWYRGSYRIVREYFNDGKSLEHYIDYVASTGLDIRDLVFPHDIGVRELGSSDGQGLARSRLDIVRELLKKKKLKWGTKRLKKLPVEAGIENVRRMIPNLHMDASCKYLIDCFLNYSKKWDERHQIFMETPLHDEFSHGADVARMIASTLTESSVSNGSSHDQPRRRTRQTGYAI